MTSDTQFKGYAIKDTSKYTEFEVIDFKPKTVSLATRSPHLLISSCSCAKLTEVATLSV